MSPAESNARSGRAWPWWRRGLTGLCTLGLALSAYLSWHYLTAGAVPGCSGGSACDEVLNSRWSAIAGILPVSGLAAGAYLAMLVCSFSIGPANAAPVRRVAWDALLVLAGAVAGSAVWFTLVQKWIVGAFCPYCMATHGTGLLVAAVVIRHALQADTDERTGAAAGTDRHRSGARFVVTRIAVGLVLAGILAAAQARLPSARSARVGESQRDLAEVDAQMVPLVGSPNARHVVTLLFDYKCPHCQQLHLMLGEAIRRYGGQLAFALSPAPLNRECNPWVPRDVDEFKDSCDLAKVALAVWRADRAAFAVFEDWMYSYNSGDRWQPRSLGEATAKAVELVGRDRFAAARVDPWIERYLQSSVHLYGETVQNGTGGVPKLVFGHRWITPQLRNPADLVTILQTRLGVPPP